MDDHYCSIFEREDLFCSLPAYLIYVCMFCLQPMLVGVTITGKTNVGILYTWYEIMCQFVLFGWMNRIYSYLTKTMYEIWCFPHQMFIYLAKKGTPSFHIYFRSSKNICEGRENIFFTLSFSSVYKKLLVFCCKISFHQICRLQSLYE